MSKNFFRRLSVIALVLSAAMSFSTLHAQSVLEQLQAHSIHWRVEQTDAM